MAGMAGKIGCGVLLAVVGLPIWIAIVWLFSLIGPFGWIGGIAVCAWIGRDLYRRAQAGEFEETTR